MSDSETAQAAAAPDGVGMRVAAGPSPMTGYGSRFLAFVLAPVLFPQSRVVLANLPILPEADQDWEGQIDGPNPLRLLVLGDSTGAGVGVESLREGLAGNLADQLHQRLGRGVSWDVIARSGATTGQIREFFLLLASRQSYDVIFLTLGVNDVMQLRRKGAFQYDLDVIVGGLAAASPNAHIMLAGIPRMEHFSSLPAPLGTILGARAYRLNAAAHTVAENHPRVVHVPPWPISTPGFFAVDNFHPSAIGYKAWAKRSIDYWLRKR
ncbi:MAG: SGNH/GDSL hydrolase family protein [Microbacteriaceae bacterium]